MGAAFVASGNRVPARSVVVFGSEMSVRPKLSGIALALEYCLAEEDLAILTDSKASIDLLRSMQREDFRMWLYRHPVRQLLVYIARLINQRTANGVVTRLVVTRHAHTHTSSLPLVCLPVLLFKIRLPVSIPSAGSANPDCYQMCCLLYLSLFHCISLSPSLSPFKSPSRPPTLPPPSLHLLSSRAWPN